MAVLTATPLTATPLTARSLIATKLGEAIGSFNPASLFGDGDKGAYFDFGNIATLFQDAEGTTPVTAVGDPVGLALDQSEGTTSLTNNLGAELVTNGGFDINDDWELSTDWSISGGSATKVIGSITNIRQTVSITEGNFYLLKFELLPGVEGRLQIRLGDITGGGTLYVTPSGVSGEFSILLQATAGTQLLFNALSDFGGSIDNVSLKALPGNHATQSTSTARPLYARVPAGGRRNELDSTESLATQDVTVTAAERTLSFAGTGTVTLSGASTDGPLVGTGVSDRVSLTFTPSAGTLTLTVSGTVTDAQLELGDTATPYQKVTADYDITEAGVASVYGLLFDGVDDSLATPDIDLTGTDNITTFAAADVGEYAGTPETISALWPADGTAWLYRGSATQTSLAAGGTTDVYSVDVTDSLMSYIGRVDISEPVIKKRVNGVTQPDSTGSQGTGNFADSPYYLGVRSTYGQLDGYIFSSGVISRSITDDETSDLEVALGQKSGISPPVPPFIETQTDDEGSTISAIDASFRGLDVGSYTMGGAPTGLSINVSTGEITGTIDDEANDETPYSVTVTATDSVGRAASVTFTWNVDIVEPVVSSDISDQQDPVDSAITTLDVSGNFTGETSYLADGTPPGVSFNESTGEFTGTPTATGSYLVEVLAINAAGREVSSEFVWTVEPATNTAPTVVTPIPDQTYDVNDVVSLNIFSNFTDDVEVTSFTASPLPSGISFDTATGLFSGVPDTGEEVTTTVEAFDASGLSVTDSFDWTINAASLGAANIIQSWTGSTGTGAAATVSATSPGATAGNVLVAVVSGKIDGSGTYVFGSISGWNEREKFEGTDSNRPIAAIWTRTATGDSNDDITTVKTSGPDAIQSIVVVELENCTETGILSSKDTSSTANFAYTSVGGGSLDASGLTDGAFRLFAGAMGIADRWDTDDGPYPLSVKPGEIANTTTFDEEVYYARDNAGGAVFIGVDADDSPGTFTNTMSTTDSGSRVVGFQLAFAPEDAPADQPAPSPDPAVRQYIAFESSFERSGGILYDDYSGPDGVLTTDSWQSAQVWGPDGSDSVNQGTEGIEIVTSPVRTSGGKAAHVKMRESWGQRGGRWRNELRSPQGRNWQYGDKHFMGVSIYIPSTANNLLWLPTTFQNQMLFQFHFPSPMPMGFHTYNNQFRMAHPLYPGVDSNYIFGTATTDVWHDFVLESKVHLSSGILRLWHQNNGGGYTKVIDIEGQTAVADGDYLNPKIGFYRAKFGDLDSQPYDEWDVYYDEYRWTEPNLGTFDDVKPGDL